MYLLKIRVLCFMPNHKQVINKYDNLFIFLNLIQIYTTRALFSLEIFSFNKQLVEILIEILRDFLLI